MRENQVRSSGISIAQNIVVKTPGLIVVATLWLLAAAAGTWGLLKYESTPTPTGSTPSRWPTDSHIARETGQFTLVMFVHPHCPCSQASMEELNRLLTHCRGTLSTHVLFVRPKGTQDDWTDTSLRKSAEAIPGVGVETDSEGVEASRFGAESSGYVVLYDPNGQLRFSGGITGSRGHAGENAGETAVIDLANGRPTPFKHTEVYGCTLLDQCGNTTNENSL